MMTSGYSHLHDITFRLNSFRKDGHEDERCYCHDTIKHLKDNEKRFTYPFINVSYAPEVASDEYYKRCALKSFRQRIIEWMISIQDYFTNCEETLEMATRLFDHIFYNDFYSVIKPTDYEKMKDLKYKHYRKHECLHLVALTCYFLSCKFWERFPPKLSKLIYLTEYAYTELELLRMEREILMKLDFDLKIPLISQYIEFYMLHEKEFYLSKITTLSHYLTNLAATEMIFTSRLASSLSAVILTLSKMILGMFSCQTSTFNSIQNNIYDERLFGLENFYEILKDVWQIFMNSMTNSSSFKLQKKKFSEQKYCYLYIYLETIDLQQLQIHYKDLRLRVKQHLEDLQFVKTPSTLEFHSAEFFFNSVSPAIQ